ncbi:hypothetical protein COHA_001673 [Chlorella ohadii]|uniref:Ubiquitin-like domain-containing protein n=1 Tax=Chlorella ohadii TaxID=2649997 RepID=A0AAD5DYA0_9CHLO|nr:hypothetical protein COHA_001673 [Chlorella ohadii]
MVTTGVLWSMGDALAQRVEKGPFDARRNLLTAGYGALAVGPFGHAWYIGLDRAARRLFVPGSAAFIAAKVANFKLVPVHYQLLVVNMVTILASAEGNQIFVVVRRGKEYPPKCCDCRIKYEQTIADVKKAAAAKLGVPLDKLLLFWQNKELTAADDSKTLLELNLHTGFSLSGYDLSVEPDFWPPVIETPEGRRIVTGQQDR